MFNRAISVVLVTHQVKKIYSQATAIKADYWPTPWRQLYELTTDGYWYSARCLENFDSSDEEGFFDTHSESERLDKLERVSMESPSWLELVASESTSIEEKMQLA